MNDKFYEQKKEKQDLLINGAMSVFAKRGYQHASIDEMVKASGVSKGLWFHYFDNKKGLYSFVVSYGIKYALLEYGIKLDKKFADFYELILDMEAVKISLMELYPYLPLLIISIIEEDDEEALSLIGDMKESYIEAVQKIYEDADRTNFVEAADSFKIQSIIDAFLMRQMRNNYKKEIFPKKEYLEECESYIKMMRSITYNE